MDTRRRISGKNKEPAGKKGEVKIFLQLMICIAVICGFMIFKDTPLPNGKTPADYVSHFLDTTVNMDKIVQKLNPEQSVPVSGSAEE